MKRRFDPRLDFDVRGHDRRETNVECYLCGKNGARAKMLTFQEGLFPKLYAHPDCANGRPVWKLQRIYHETIDGLFGRTPRMTS